MFLLLQFILGENEQLFFIVDHFQIKFEDQIGNNSSADFFIHTKSFVRLNRPDRVLQHPAES